MDRTHTTRMILSPVTSEPVYLWDVSEQFFHRLLLKCVCLHQSQNEHIFTKIGEVDELKSQCILTLEPFLQMSACRKSC